MDYGLDVSIWYCDANHMTDPQEVNHVIVDVDFPDGTGLLIETTSDSYYTHEQVMGWEFEV